MPVLHYSQSDLVVRYASPDFSHAGEMSKPDFRKMVQTLGVKLAGEAAMIASPPWTAAVDSLFDTLDPDHSGYLDSAEATGQSVPGTLQHSTQIKHDPLNSPFLSAKPNGLTWNAPS